MRKRRRLIRGEYFLDWFLVTLQNVLMDLKILNCSQKYVDRMLRD